MVSTQSQLTTAMSEQTILDQAQKLLQELQEAMASFTNTDDRLTRHDGDSSAHIDIRELIQGIVSGDGLISRDDAMSEISKAIATHDTSGKAHVHISQQLQVLSESLATLTERVSQLEPTPPDDGTSELEKKLKAIDDYYDPTLQALMDAWNIAKMNNTGTADAIAAEYQKLSQEKAQAIADVMREYVYA